MPTGESLMANELTTSSGGTPGHKPMARIVRFSVASPMSQPAPVRHLNAPPPHPQRERIHRRRVLPPVKRGRERALHSVTRELTYHLQTPIRANTDDLVLITNTELSQPGQQQLASGVGEPSVAVAGDVVMYTGNWYAARSIDAGQ